MKRRVLPLLMTLLGATAAQAQAPSDAPVTTTTTSTTTTTTSTGVLNPTAAGETPFAINEGWNSRWAMLFSLNNILVVGNVLSSPVNGTLGGTYFLSRNTGIRGGLSIGHANAPATVTKVVTTSGEQTLTTYQVTNPQGFTDQYNVNARAEYLWRLLQSSVAPYVGAGGQIGWTWSRQSYTDDKSVVGVRTNIDNHNTSFAVTARALAGVEWRFHPSFALYADYSVNLAVYTNTHLSNQTTLENTVGNATSTNRTLTTQDVNSWLNLTTGINQGASLGLQAYF